MDDSGDLVDLREELWLVRRRLERLLSDRLNHSLSPQDEQIYHDLSRREVELIWELAVVDLSEHDSARDKRDEHDSGVSRAGRQSNQGPYDAGSSSDWNQYFDAF